MPRFVLVAGRAPAIEAALAARAPARSEFRGATVYHWNKPSSTSFGTAGMLLGDSFRVINGRSAPFGSPSAKDIASLVGEGASWLVDGLWGSYIAIVARGGAIEVYRSACGEVPCFYRQVGQATVVFSEIGDVVGLPGLDWALDRRRVAAALIDPRVTARATAVVGVSELLGGECLMVSGGGPPELAALWTPAAAAAAAPIASEAAAETRLRDVVLDTVGAWAQRHPRLGLLLSGGLDSSLLLASFTAVAPGCLVAGLHHQLPDDPTGSRPAGTPALKAAVGSADERDFAEAAARHAGLPLEVAPRRVGTLDGAALEAAPISPWPTGFAYRLDVARAEVAFARAHGLSALVSGHAGDQVLFNGLTPLTAADHLWIHGLRGFPRRLDEASRRSGRPLPQVLALAIRHGLLRQTPPRPARFADSGGYVSAAARAMIDEDDLATPWEAALAHLPPAKALHARYVGTCLAFAGAQPAPGLTIVNPLHSQRVVETCLAVPTPVLTTGGIGRGLARRAFGDLLAPSVAARRTKAGGAGFIQALVEQNRRRVRADLLDGLAVAAGLLDRSAVEAGLGDGGLRGPVEAVQVVDYLAVEAWLRAWHRAGATIVD